MSGREDEVFLSHTLLELISQELITLADKGCMVPTHTLLDFFFMLLVICFLLIVQLGSLNHNAKV